MFSLGVWYVFSTAAVGHHGRKGKIILGGRMRRCAVLSNLFRHLSQQQVQQVIALASVTVEYDSMSPVQF